MNQSQFEALLKDLKIGKVEYFPSTTSTNDIAMEWVRQGVPDFSVIAADSQSSGRGRSGRTWYTYPASALAFSIILKPQIEPLFFPRYTALGAIGVCQALAQSSNSPTWIKWPNDVLIENKKVAGILTEVQWHGSQPQAVIIGIGVNILAASLPQHKKLNYPATFFAAHTPVPPDRFKILHKILAEIKTWHQSIASPKFINKWESLLAFRGQEIEILLISPESQRSLHESDRVLGQLIGIDQTGMLLLKLPNGKIRSFASNEIKILPKE